MPLPRARIAHLLRRALGPGALTRLDEPLLERIRAGDRLGAIAASCIATIVLGAGAYGIAFGIWRAPEQAVFAAIKLPLLFLAVAACTIALSSILAVLLGARLSLAQTTVCILLSFAVTSALLGAAAPIAIVLCTTVPAPDPIALGLATDDPRALPSMHVAQALLLVHVFVVACAGTAGVARMRALLRRLGNREAVTKRVLVGWIGAQLMVGSQLSWLLRPFFGRPHLPPTFTVDDTLEGGFFEEVMFLATATFGDAAPLVCALALGSLAAGLAWTMRVRIDAVAVRREEVGLVVLGALEHVVPWAAIARATQR
nr:hypothetical protein [Myxococcota bacterium]